jgi:uncharacterized membrane protein YtjA (UPF0391 family)
VPRFEVKLTSAGAGTFQALFSFVLIGRWSALAGNLSGKRKGKSMIGLTMTFLVLAVVAGLLGFIAIVATSMGMAEILFSAFLLLFSISLFVGRRGML